MTSLGDRATLATDAGDGRAGGSAAELESEPRDEQEHAADMERIGENFAEVPECVKRRGGSVSTISLSGDR